MRCFVLLTDHNAQGIPDAILHRYEALPKARGWEFAWRLFRNAAVLTAWDDPWGEPLVARYGDHVAFGTVRLDNRAELATLAAMNRKDCQPLTDLELLLCILVGHGPKCISRVLGDFGFIVWNGDTRMAIAAVDAFAVNKIYYSAHQGLLAFASRAETLALNERYDVHYLTELLVRQTSPRGHTVYADVLPIPAATIAAIDHGVLSSRTYWNPLDFDIGHDWDGSEQEAAEACRQLLGESIRMRLTANRTTWAQLSGGIDSSSVVSLAQWLLERGEVAEGLAGTATLVDRQGTGVDEREYSEAVVRRWRIRNEVVVDSPTWHEDGYEPPRIDQPRFDLAFSPRDRRLCALIRSAGGKVLLTGWGGDELFMGSMFFFADWVVQGELWRAVRGMARCAALGRVSFWELAYRNALLPLLPPAAHNRLVRNRDDSPPQPWLEEAAMHSYGLSWRSPSVAEYGGRIGEKYRHAIAMNVASLPTVAEHGVIADSLDVRHPFLYRPLVEFALRLPHHMRARPHAHRWVLRQAMRDILPEKIRVRVGKPDAGEVLAWSLATERPHLALLLRDPILAQLGVINSAKLRKAFDALSYHTGLAEWSHVSVLSTLAVEAWLEIRSGGWPHGGHLSSAARTTLVHPVNQPSA